MVSPARSGFNVFTKYIQCGNFPDAIEDLLGGGKEPLPGLLRGF
jgi:hypothetical protein